MRSTLRKDKPWVTVDTASNIVRKVWLKPRFDERWLSNHVDMLELVAPNRLISFGANDTSVYIDMEYVPGPTVRDWMNSHIEDADAVHEMMGKTIRYWVDMTAGTYPYAHWDWTGGNTIMVSDNVLTMIDWDQCRKASVEDIKDRMLHTISLEFIHGDSHRYAQRYIDVASSYFDEKFKNIGK